MKSSQESMNSTARTDKFKCAAAAAAVTLLFVCFISVKWDFYWDLNDDLMIDRLLTGAYTGEPAARDIQNMFPFSFILSRLQILLNAGFGIPVSVAMSVFNTPLSWLFFCICFAVQIMIRKA